MIEGRKPCSILCRFLMMHKFLLRRLLFWMLLLSLRAVNLSSNLMLRGERRDLEVTNELGTTMKRRKPQFRINKRRARLLIKVTSGCDCIVSCD